jgi:inorganic triphosphatase YgiF
LFRQFPRNDNMTTTILRDRDSSAQDATLAGPTQRMPTCRACFQRIASRCLQMIESHHNLSIVAEPDAVHGMRMEITRLRAAALFFVPTTDDAAWPDLDRQLRWLNSALGKARNRDVAVEYADRKHYRRWAGHSRRTLLRSQEGSSMISQEAWVGPVLQPNL